jgi:hypothetical protein
MIFMLRYPFATFIVTFGLFSFLALLVASGEVRLSLHEPEPHYFTIEKVTLTCASDTHKHISDALLKAAEAQCNTKTTCNIPTTDLMQKANIPVRYGCAQELTFTYHCSPATDKKPDAPLRATLYRGQTASLPCHKAGA